MAKSLTLANGSILIGLDQFGQVRDVYYPHIGLSNHVSGASGSYTHRIGVWVDGTLAWLDEPSWNVRVGVSNETAEGMTEAVNETLGVSLTITDVVYNEKNIFLRNVIVTNASDTAREIKVFFAQQFRISEDRNGSTGFFDPRVHALIHYKGHTNFLVNAMNGKTPFDDYTTGLFDMEGNEGSHIDAGDGRLSKNPIEHGSVDSVLGLSSVIGSNEKTDIEYWLAVGQTIDEVHDLNAYIIQKSPEHLRRTTRNYWRAWLNQYEPPTGLALNPELMRLYEQSLLIMRAHTDHGGGIIASSDSDLLQHGRDTYSYVWPRDGAMIAHALDRAGYVDSSRRFFEFSNSIIEPDGYFMHKYRVDGTLGSSWHPWMRDGKPELPIQEDETAIVLFMLWKHFERAHDLEFIEAVYGTLIAPAADFMLGRIDQKTKLPVESYDLWEETFGTSTYTASSVYGGLMAAANFAKILGKQKSEKKYRDAADAVQKAIVQNMFDSKSGVFYKYIRRTKNGVEKNTTADASSLRGLILFGVLPINDSRIERLFTVIDKKLRVPEGIGGYVRYENDQYYHAGDTKYPNPWFVTTLWVAQYHIAKAKTLDELAPALDILMWARAHAFPTYVLSEQLHPQTGTPLSTAPLVWSHAEYVITILDYLEKIEELE